MRGVGHPSFATASEIRSWAGAITERRTARVIGAIILALTALMLASFAAQTVAAATPTSNAGSQANYDGLSKQTVGPCAGLYKVELADGRVLCTVGPDPGPPGTDLTKRPTVKDFRSAVAQAAFGLADGLGPDGVPCIGNGTNGPRIQAVYARPADVSDRYGAIAPIIQEVAGLMDAAMMQSAAETGGERHLRFVTNPDCTLNVAHVVLTSGGDDTFSDTIDELIAQGYDQPGRKYHVWVDTSDLYCGIANQFSDDRPGQENLNNTATLYARTDAPCWGAVEYGPFTVELHEVMHTLGAVQGSAPNATPYGHCTDEWDLMCYEDSAETVLEYICTGDRDHMLDCNHDDYFHTSPSPGSYLATHWNTATSQFLAGALDGPPAGPDNVAAVSQSWSSIWLTWDDVVGETGYRIKCREGSSLVTCRDGLPAGTTSYVRPGLDPETRYDFQVCAYSQAGEACSDEFGATTDAALAPTKKIIDDKQQGFTKYRSGWKKQSVGWKGRSYWVPVRRSGSNRYAVWKAALDAPGAYEVWVRYPKKNATTRSAKYKVFTDAGVVTRSRNQKATPGRWVKLGTFEFGALGKVKLTDQTGERTSSGRRIVFDAVRFVPISPAAGSTVTVEPEIVTEEPSASPLLDADSSPAPDAGATTDPSPPSSPDQAPTPTRSPSPEPVTRPSPAPTSTARPTPAPDPPEETAQPTPTTEPELKLRLFPKSVSAVVGARKSVSAWTCPADDTSPFGPDHSPGTVDDDCDPIEVEWSVQESDTARVTRANGHSTLVQLTSEADNRLTASTDELTRNARLEWKPRPSGATTTVPTLDGGG